MREPTILWPMLVVVLLLGQLILPISMAGPEGPVPSGTDTGPRDGELAPWPMFQRDRAHTGYAAAIGWGITDPYELWDNAPVDCLGSTIGDLRNNVVLEGTPSFNRPGLHGVYTQGITLHIVEGATGTDMWSVNLGSNVIATTGLLDTDSDERLEVAVVTVEGEVSLFEPTITWNGTSYSYNQSSALGDRTWNTDIQEPVTLSSITLGDLTGDLVPDILFSSWSRVHALNGTSGQPLWNFTVEGQMTSTPAIITFGESIKRVAVTTYNTTGADLNIYMINDQGNQLWNDTYSVVSGIPPQTVLVPPSISVGDLDGDSAEEMVVTIPFVNGHGEIRAFEINGDPVWGVTVFTAVGQIDATPAIADLDADGDDDIIIVSWNASLMDTQAHVFAIEGSSGTELWSKHINDDPGTPMSELVRSSPALGDMDGDEVPDVIVATANGVVHALNGTNGQRMWKLDIGRLSLVSSPAIADMDGNGITDIFLDGTVIAHLIVDLSIVAGDVTFSDPSPEEDDTLHISALVHNVGTKAALNATIRFADLYDNGMTHLGSDVINVSAGGTAEASLDHVITGGGKHIITITLDPDQDFEELDETNNEATRSLTVSSHYSVSLSSDTGTVYVDPGEQAIFSITVTNTGDMENTISLATSSAIPQGWNTWLTKEEVTLAPLGEETIALIVTTGTSSLGGAYPINLTGTSTNKPSNHNTIETVTFIRGDYGISMTADVLEKSINAEGFALYDINLTNVGNSMDSISLTNTSPSNSSWWVFLSNDSVLLDPVTSQGVSLTVKPPSDANEGDVETITMEAISQGDPLQRASLVFTTRIVRPDLAVLNMTFHRNDGLEVDGQSKHLISNRTSTVNVTVTNLLGNIDYIQSVMLQLFIDGILSGSAFVDIYGDEVLSVPVDTAFDMGDHLVRVCFDANDFIDEDDEVNNCLQEQVSVKSDTSVGPYEVYGTIFWPTGARLANTDVQVMNMRTMESFDLKTNNQGNYSVDILDLPSGYLEEESIKVKASNGVTVREVTFLAFSEDLSREVDIIMVPGPYDFFIGPQIKVSTGPGQPALFSMYLNQLGNATNNVDLKLSEAPEGWSTVMQDELGNNIDNVTVGGGSVFQFSITITPPQDARVEPGRTFTLVGTSTIQTDKVFSVDLIVEVLQVHRLNATYTGGSAIRGHTASFNLSVENGGNGEEVVTPSVGDNPLGWPVTFSTETLNLTYFATRNILVEVEIPSNASLGTYTLGVKLGYGVDQHLDVPLDVQVLEYEYGFTLKSSDIGVQDIVPGTTRTYTLMVTNDGNVDNGITFFVTGPPSDWDVELTDVLGAGVTNIQLQKGQAMSLLLTVKAPRETKGTRHVVINTSGISTKDPSERGFVLILLSVHAADLIPGGNLTLSKRKLTDGDYVDISLDVKNIGTAPVEGAVAEFYVDDRSIGTVPIEYIEPNGNLTIRIEWKAKEGGHTILVRLNPNETLVEMNYGNNEIKTTVNVEEDASEFAMGVVAILIVVMVIIIVLFLYYKRPDLVPRPLRREEEEEDEEDEEEDEEDEEDEEEEEEEDEDYDDEHEDDEEDEEEVVHVAEIIEEEPERKRRPKKRKGKGKGRSRKLRKGRRPSPRKKVARPWSYHEDGVEEDLEDDGGIVRFG